MNRAATSTMASGARARAGWASDRKLAWAYALVLGITIIYSAVPFEYFLLSRPPVATTEWGAPNPLSRAVKLLILGTAVAMILWRLGLARIMLKVTDRFMLVFMILVPVSILWSIDAQVTLARFMSLLLMFVVAFAFPLLGWHARRYQDVVRPTLTLLLGASLIFGLIEPSIAIEVGNDMSLKGAWRGLMLQKNAFGEAAAFGVMFWFHALLAADMKRWRTFGGLAIAGACLLLSRSSASMLSTVFGCTLMWLIVKAPRNARPYVPFMLGTFAVVVGIYAAAALKLVPGLDIVFTPITMLTGKDMTFSNRTAIWDIVEQHIRLSPWIGSGYGAYWSGKVPTSPSYYVLIHLHFYPSQSHNGYLEIINDLGVLGLFVLLAYLVVYVRQSLMLLRLDRPQAALFLALIFQQIVMNLSETCFFATTSGLTTTIIMTATCCLARSLLEHRFRQNRGRSMAIA